MKQLIFLPFILNLFLFTSCKKDDHDIEQPNHADLIAHIDNETEYSFSQSYYVREPGNSYGTGDGSSWANAFSDLPDDLVRGAKYYLASGNYDIGDFEEYYEWQSFDDPEDGDLFIGIFKATENDHGTDDGWQTSMGTGVANIGPISITTGNYVFDGQTGKNTSGYGIKITTRDGDNDEAKLVRFPWDTKSHHIYFKHVEMEHTGTWGYNTLHPAHDAIKGDPVDDNVTLEYLYFINCYIHDSHRALLVLLDAKNVLFDKCYFARSGLHQECTSIGIRNSDNIVFRRNIFVDTKNNFFSIRSVKNFYIYSNIFIGETDNTLWEIYAGIEVSGDYGYNIYIFNNTFYNLPGLNCGVRLLSENMHVYTQNNIWANCKTNQISLHGNHSHNAFYENYRIKGYEDNPQKYDENIEEEYKQIFTSNPFVDAANHNFKLNYGTDTGNELEPPFNTDFDGNIRGEDGIWDRGAFEFKN